MGKGVKEKIYGDARGTERDRMMCVLCKVWLQHLAAVDISIVKKRRRIAYTCALFSFIVYFGSIT